MADSFDFRKPPPSTLEERVGVWLREACGIALRIWPKLLTFSADMTVNRVQAVSAVRSIEELPEGCFAFRLSTAKYADCVPVLAMARPLLLGLINGCIGTPTATLPADRDLSTVETSVCNFIVEKLFLDLLCEGWPSADRPRFAIAARGEPRGVSTLPPNDLVLSAELMLNGPFGEHPIYLIMPRVAPILQLVKPAVDPVPVLPASKEQLEALVGEMAVDFQVTLGSTQVTMLQLAQLRTGDVVVLTQKTNEPLQAKVAGKDKFSVWPGAIGRRQAVQIEGMVEP